MAIQKWLKVKVLKDSNSVLDIEQQLECTISDELRQCIRDHNGGRPTPNVIRLVCGEENDVDALLSFNEEDMNSVYRIKAFFAEKYLGILFPFASDSAGNYYCENKGKIVLWTQDDEVFDVCNSFGEFLEALYAL